MESVKEIEPSQHLDALRKRGRTLSEGIPSGVDIEVYARWGRDPDEPLLCGGQLAASIGFFGRDPGRDEVRLMTPLIGAAGQLVRAGVHRALVGEEPGGARDLEAAGQRVFLSNTVPYKPVGNKAWSMAVKRLFRPVVVSLLVDCWRGHHLVTLGNVAFDWFGIDASRDERARLKAFWARADRYECSPFEVELTSALTERTKRFSLLPLPHPSPLNAVWYPKFPALLDQRFEQLSALGVELKRE